MARRNLIAVAVAVTSLVAACGGSDASIGDGSLTATTAPSDDAVAALVAEGGIATTDAECLLAADGELLSVLQGIDDLVPDDAAQALARIGEATDACGLTVGDLGLSLGTGVSDDATLQAWYDACAAGDMTACDDLFFQSPYDSEFEQFGSTCGGTREPTEGNCD
jgi:hypothetical protein